MTTLQTTKHMAQRMSQRHYTETMINAILGLGEWNERGDQLIVDGRQETDIEQMIISIRRECKKLNKKMNELKRLRQKRKSTLVIKDKNLITVY